MTTVIPILCYVLECHERKIVAPALRSSQFSAEYRWICQLIVAMHCGKGSEVFVSCVVEAQKRGRRLGAGLQDGNLKGSTRNLQVERRENVILGRENNICKGRGAIFDRSVIGYAPDT